ncbi:MAG: hypothetical protein QXX99_06260 [Candidatus Bathyarchaeia archaeon]
MWFNNDWDIWIRGLREKIKEEFLRFECDLILLSVNDIPYVIELVKRRLVEKLVEMGLKRKETARKTGLSISAVSRYFQWKEEHTQMWQHIAM